MGGGVGRAAPGDASVAAAAAAPSVLAAAADDDRTASGLLDGKLDVMREVVERASALVSLSGGAVGSTFALRAGADAWHPNNSSPRSMAEPRHAQATSPSLERMLLTSSRF